MEYLLVAATEVDTKAAAKFLSMSIEFIGILGKIVDCIAYHLVCTLELSYWYPEDIEALTGEGFRYFLEKTRNEDGEPLFWSKTEFIRLRNIILWCTCKEFPSPWYCLPAEIKSTRYYLDNWKFETNQSSAVYSGAKAVLALSVKPYLPFVNLRRIEPLYLVRIFEPMDIIPSSVLMDAFRFHVLQTSGQTEEYFRWSASCDDLCDGTYSTSSEGFVIQRTELGIGFAKYGFCMKNRGRGKWFDWEVIIEEVCDGFIEIGLHHEHDLDGDLIPEEDQSLSGQPGGWALRMDPQGLSIIGKANHGSYSSQGPNYVSREIYNGPGRDYSQLVYGKDFAHKNSKVKFSFDEGRNECFFTLHDDKREEAWDDIPHGYLYPAVSLGSGSNGRVRIKILQIL